MSKEKFDNIWKPLFIGFMRMMTLNFNLWCKPTDMGWKKR